MPEGMELNISYLSFFNSLLYDFLRLDVFMGVPIGVVNTKSLGIYNSPLDNLSLF